MVREVSTSRSSTGHDLTSPATISRARTAAAKNDRDFRDRARIVPWATAHFANGPGPMGPREDRPRFDRSRDDRPKFDRPRRDRDGAPGRNEGRTDWQEHSRSDRGRRITLAIVLAAKMRTTARSSPSGRRSAVVAPIVNANADPDRRAPRPAPKPKKTGERIAKTMARAGVASRRDAEEWITQGRVTVNGRVINSPALDVTVNDVVAIDGKPLPPRERTRLFLYHKPERADDDACRSRRPTHGVRRICRKDCLRLISNRPARFQHRAGCCCSPTMAVWRVRSNCRKPAGCAAIVSAPMARSRRPSSTN